MEILFQTMNHKNPKEINVSNNIHLLQDPPLRNGLALFAAGSLYCGLAKYKGISNCSWLEHSIVFGVVSMVNSAVSSFFEDQKEQSVCSIKAKTLNHILTVGMIGAASKFCAFKYSLLNSPNIKEGVLFSTAAIAAGYFGINKLLEPSVPEVIEEDPPEPHPQPILTELNTYHYEFIRLLSRDELPLIPIIVKGDLDLGDKTELKSLPERLEVKGALYLDGCTSLEKLPDNLKVGGDLNLKGCIKLTELPQNLRVEGGIKLEGCTSLIGLPEGLQVEGDINLKGCTTLQELPENFHCKGELNLDGCTGLTELPDEMNIPGHLGLVGCTGLRVLPKGLKVGQVLALRGCTNITSLPEDLKFGGTLDISGGCGITEIPEGIEIPHKLCIKNCSNFESLPDNLIVGENLVIENCPKLTTLPNGLHVKGGLFIRSERNTQLNIRKLPDNLFVGGELDATGSGRLRALGKGTRIEGHLDLSQCGISALPEDLFVGGDIGLSRSNLSVLPSWLTKLGPKSNGELRVINLENTKLIQEDIDLLKGKHFPGIRIFLSDRAHPFAGEVFLNGGFYTLQNRRDFETLGLKVQDNPKKKNVKKAYKALARKHHPDKNNGAGEEMFKTIQEAYERLMKTLSE